MIDRLLEALDGHDGAVPALPVADTLAHGAAGCSATMVDRAGLVRVQTPQAFHFEDLLDAYDEAGLARSDRRIDGDGAAGLQVAMVEGDPMLDKLTTAADWARAEAMLAARLVTRTGMGFDVHAFAGEGRSCSAGSPIPHERGLAGHSDADVVLHAITDALLGAGGAGRYRRAFPAVRPAMERRRVRPVSSLMPPQLVRDRGGIIDHVDCTVICEAPKVGPHRAAMRAASPRSWASPTAVSIKATTTERLGFTGRGEGIAAQAVATIRMEIEP